MGFGSPKEALDRIAMELVRVRSYGNGGVITTPVLFPSGAHVTVRVSFENDRCLVTDDGAAYAEADMMGALGIFRRSAKKVAEEAGIRFNSFEIFEAEATPLNIAGIVAIIADAAKRCIEVTSEKLARRLELDLRDSVIERLIEAFGATRVKVNAPISGASTHSWTVDALIDTEDRTVAVEIVSPSPISVSSCYMKLDDIRRLDEKPRTVAALSHRSRFGSDQLLILNRTAKLIDVNAGAVDFRRLAA